MELVKIFKKRAKFYYDEKYGFIEILKKKSEESVDPEKMSQSEGITD